MRRTLAPALAAAALLSACATAPKLPALPPPVDAAPAGQPAQTTWYQPLQTDAAAKWNRGGLGVLFAPEYAFTTAATRVKTEVDGAKGPEMMVAPLKAELPAVYFNMGPGFYGFTYGKMDLSLPGLIPGPVTVPTTVLGLYEGIRVPITLLDLKGPDVQLFLIPGLTLQVLYMSGKDDASSFEVTYGLVASGSLNVAGVGLAVGDWLVLEADFWKWGWSYVDLMMKRPDGKDQTGSFSAFAHGKAPVFFARVQF